MKTAALYWPTSSVGGINTELRALRDEAERRGDLFDVLRSGKQKGIQPGQFLGGRKLIRGGDTFLTIDGEAPHHPLNIAKSIEFISRNYDRVYLAYLCPHPTKDYGLEPLFLPLLAELRKRGMPILGRVTDGYWESYADWGKETVELCTAVTVSQPAFASFFEHPRVHASRFPFSPRKTTAQREKKLLTVWTSQWKAIKGIHKLLPYLPAIPGDVELYSNGILYYQLRTTEEWKKAVGRDHFGATTPSGPFNGTGKAEFFGYIPLDEIPNVLTRAWFMIDLMGIGKPKNKVYTEGSFNNTTVEALYYGCLPILHEQAMKSVPKEIALSVTDAREVSTFIGDKDVQKWALDKERQRKAKKWVLDNFAASIIYDGAILGKYLKTSARAAKGGK